MTSVLVVGIGGIGGNLLAGLATTGVDVLGRTRNQNVLDTAKRGELKWLIGGESIPFKATVVKELPPDLQFDFVLLATQPPQVEAAAEFAKPYLKEDGAVVVFQNGLCEQRVAKIVGENRVIGGIVSWGASMNVPGHFERTADGFFTLGSLAPRTDNKVKQLGQMLEAVAPVSYTDNLTGARWSKLILNSAISSLGTLAGERLGKLIRVRRFRRLALEVMSEGVRVAQAHGESLEKLSGTVDLDWLALTPGESRGPVPSLAAKHALLLAVGTRYRRLRSSMLAALERGDPPAVDFLNGEIVQYGKQHGIATPINAEVVSLIWQISRGEKRSRKGNLLKLYFESKERRK